MNESILRSLQRKYPINALQKVLKLPKNISLSQLDSLIRREFRKAVGRNTDAWISDIYKDYVVAFFAEEGKYYKIPFAIDGTSIKFDLSKKVEVIRSWQEVK